MRPAILGSEAQLSATQGPSASVDRKQKKNDTAILPDDFISKNQGPATSALASRLAAHWDSSSTMNEKQQDTDNARLSRDFDYRKQSPRHPLPLLTLSSFAIKRLQCTETKDASMLVISEEIFLTIQLSQRYPLLFPDLNPRLEPRTALYREQSHARKESLATSSRVPHLTASQDIKAASTL
ncbi:hypothetical protein BGZ54_009217 [Gamsiella multidivaricata]|nr:hypothetical protein BGZ54_009217 [Gamsiella multidivaricata]